MHAAASKRDAGSKTRSPAWARCHQRSSRRERHIDPWCHADAVVDALCCVAVPAPPLLHTKVVNISVIQAWWEPSSKMGQHQGYRLYYKGAQAPLFTGPIVLPHNASQYIITQLGELLFLRSLLKDPGLPSQVAVRPNQGYRRHCSWPEFEGFRHLIQDFNVVFTTLFENCFPSVVRSVTGLRDQAARLQPTRRRQCYRALCFATRGSGEIWWLAHETYQDFAQWRVASG